MSNQYLEFACAVCGVAALFIFVLNITGFFSEVVSQKDDGQLYIYIDGIKAQTINIGHRTAVELCQKHDLNGYREIFEGCGAFNCRYDTSSINGEYSKVFEQIIIAKEKAGIKI